MLDWIPNWDLSSLRHYHNTGYIEIELWMNHSIWTNSSGQQVLPISSMSTNFFLLGIVQSTRHLGCHTRLRLSYFSLSHVLRRHGQHASPVVVDPLIQHLSPSPSWSCYKTSAFVSSLLSLLLCHTIGFTTDSTAAQPGKSIVIPLMIARLVLAHRKG